MLYKFIIFIICLSYSLFTQANETSLIELNIEQDEHNNLVKEEIYEINEINLQNMLRRSQILYDANNIDAAQKILLQILAFTEANILYQEQIFTLLKLGNIEFNLAKKIDAAKYYYTAINLSIEHNETKYLGLLYSKLSYLYFSSDLSFAKTYLELAISENIIQNNLILLTENYYNIALIYKNLGLLTKAKEAEENYHKYNKQASKPHIYKLADNASENDYRIRLANNEDYLEAKFAYLQILNKIDGFTYMYENKIGQKINFKTIEIITKACLKNLPQDLPENMLLLEVKEQNQKSTETIFNGWMFSSSPSLNSLEHPIYDIKIIDCVTDTI